MKDSVVLDNIYTRDKNGLEPHNMVSLLRHYTKYKSILFASIVICSTVGILFYFLHILIIAYCTFYFYNIGELKDHNVRYDIITSAIISFVTFMINIIRYFQLLIFLRKIVNPRHPMDDIIQEHPFELNINVNINQRSIEEL